jgi:hypothetical protein
MLSKRLIRIIREGSKDVFVDPATLNSYVAAVARNAKAAALRWHRRRGKGCFELDTLCGMLRVHAHFRGFWTVTRDGIPLVHAHNGREALIEGLPEAKATVLVHATGAFGNRAPIGTGLVWRSDKLGQSPIGKSRDDALTEAALVSD